MDTICPEEDLKTNPLHPRSGALGGNVHKRRSNNDGKLYSSS